MNRDKTPKGNQKGEDLPFLKDGDITYNPGDCVYVESQRPDIPYFICSIKDFKKSKRDVVFVNVVWFYRPCEVPASVYQLLVQDRNTENGSSDHVLEDPNVKERELFISDAVDTYPSTSLRGKCRVQAFADVKAELEQFTSQQDSWFYLLRYNPESRRLANTKGEIRIGVSHQAALPDYVERTKESLEDYHCELPETLVWRPALHDTHLIMYLRAARSITSFSGYCEEGGSPDRALHLFSEDATTFHSLDLLHKNDYDMSQALQELVQSPQPSTVKTKWQDEERRRFSKGLRQHGKNFHKIRKDMLQEKETTELVHYYYIWKKTSFAVNSRPHKRGRRHNVLCRRNRTAKPKTTVVSEYLDLSSCSEDELDSDDSDRDLSLYACRHCFATESPNWHHAGKSKLLVCHSCRIFFKKYGRMAKVEGNREPPPYIFKAAFENREEELLGSWSSRIRTRRSTTPISSTNSNIRNKILQEIQEARHNALVPKKSSDSPRSSSNGTDASSDCGGVGSKRTTKAAKKRLLLPTDDEAQSNKKSRTASGEESDSESESSSTCDSPSEEGPLDNEDDNNNESSAPSPCQSDREAESGNEDSRCSSPVCEDAEKDARIASRFTRLPVEGQASCARVCMMYKVKRPKKEKPAATSHEEEIKSTAIKRESALKNEAERRQRHDVRRSPSPVSITTTPAQITSTFEAMRAFLQHPGNEHMMNSPHLPFMYPGGVPQMMGGPHHVLNAHHHLHQHNMEAEASASKYGNFVEMMSRNGGGSRYQHLAHGDHAPHPSHHPHSMMSAGGQHPLDSMARASPRQGIDMMPLGMQHPHVHSHMHTHTHLHLHPNEATHGGHYSRDQHAAPSIAVSSARGRMDSPLKIETSPFVRQHSDVYHHLAADGHYRGSHVPGVGSGPMQRDDVISPAHAHELASMRGHDAQQQIWLAQVAARQHQAHSSAQQQHYGPESAYQSAAYNPMRLSSDCDEYFRFLRSLGSNSSKQPPDFGPSLRPSDRHHHVMDARMAATYSNLHHGDPLRRTRDGSKPVTIDLCEE